MQLKSIIALFLFFVVYHSMCSILVASDIPYYEINGYGTQTEGGLSGTVIKVVNLNKSGTGSFKAACEADGKRLIVFEVGGVIDLEMSTITIRNPYITIAGQTAPSPGITLIKGSLNVNTHDVVVQHIAIRPGEAGQAKQSSWEPDGIGTNGSQAYNIVLDHCSTTWAVDENLSVSGPGDSEPMTSSHDITLYKCLIAEGLSYSTHSKGEHSKGTLIHDGVVNISIIGCLYAHNKRRNPFFKGNTRAVVVNTIMYNTGDRCVHMADYGTDSDTIIGKSVGALVGNVKNRECVQIYLENNILKDRTGADMEDVDNYIKLLDSPPLWPDGLVTKSANEALYDVLKTVGARAGERDAIDTRIIQSVIDGTGEIIDSENEVGGYPSYTLTTQVINVPESEVDRKAWLDSLSAAIDELESLDTSPLDPVITAIDIKEQQRYRAFKLYLTNYPNPFNPLTTIRFHLDESNKITLKIYNITGQEIETLVNRYQTAGKHEIAWQPKALPSGVYLYQLETEDFKQTRKLMLMK